MKLSIAIVGAGLSGLTIANVIGDHADVSVFEKARGVVMVLQNNSISTEPMTAI